MQLKKILFSVLVAIMMFSLVALAVSADATSTSLDLVADVESATESEGVVAVKPGERFSYTVYVENNPGIASLQFTVSYNTEAIEYVEYNGNFYGTSREDLSKDKVVILEPAGVKAYVQKAKELIKICYLRTSIEYRLKRMIARMDDPKEIEKRIQNDDLIFNKELETLADWVIDSNDISLEDLTEQIYQLYKPFV